MGLTLKDKEKALKLVDILFSKYHLESGLGYTEKKCEESIRPWYVKNWYGWTVENEEELYNMGISLYSGETKGVICPNEENWVIKIGFKKKPNHFHVEKEDHSDEYERARVEKDYSVLELLNYEKAVKEGLQDFFAETIFLGKFYGSTVYMQEKAEPCEDELDSAVYSNLKSKILSNPYGYGYEEYIEENCCDDKNEDEKMSDFIDQTFYEMEDDDLRVETLFDGKEKLSELLNFISENEITDLHNGNFGLTITGQWKIFDFSGYYG